MENKNPDYKFALSDYPGILLKVERLDVYKRQVDICPKARIQGFPIDSENWFDVGKPETLAKAEAYYASL